MIRGILGILGILVVLELFDFFVILGILRILGIQCTTPQVSRNENKRSSAWHYQDNVPTLSGGDSVLFRTCDGRGCVEVRAIRARMLHSPYTS